MAVKSLNNALPRLCPGSDAIRSNGTNGILLDSGCVYNVNIPNSFVPRTIHLMAADAHGI